MAESTATFPRRWCTSGLSIPQIASELDLSATAVRQWPTKYGLETQPSRYHAALQFHHVDPATKEFQIGGRGLTRALADLRREARKCALLCANCHAMVGAGIATLPQAVPWPTLPPG